MFNSRLVASGMEENQRKLQWPPLVPALGHSQDNRYHRKMPWQKNYEPEVLNIEIPLTDLREYFLPYVKTKEAA